MIGQILNDGAESVYVGKVFFWYGLTEKLANWLPALANSIDQQLI